MAKSKKKSNLISLILKGCVVLFSALTILSFFLPTFGPASADIEKGKVASFQICFVSYETASDRAAEYTGVALEESIKGNKELASQATNKARIYQSIADLKNPESKFASKTNATAWFHFISAVTAIGAIVLVALSFFMKIHPAILRLLMILEFVLMLISLIIGISLLNTVDTLIFSEYALKDYFSLRFGGVILGLISAALTNVACWIPIKGKNINS